MHDKCVLKNPGHLVLMDELFDVLSLIQGQGRDDVRSIWFSAEPGPIDAFGKFEDYQDDNTQTFEQFIILQTVYRHKQKIPLLLKAGMGMEILNNINRSLDNVSEEYKLKTLAWNGIIFNAILYWANRGFEDPVDVLAAQLTELTQALYDSKLAAMFDTEAREN